MSLTDISNAGDDGAELRAEKELFLKGEVRAGVSWKTGEFIVV